MSLKKSYILLVSFLVQVLFSKYTYGQVDKKFFRKDYDYIEETGGFYKIHTIHRTWQDARKWCAMEGASLFYPVDQTEVDEVITYWNKTQHYHWIYIGISDLLSKGVFQTIDGIPVADVYNNWDAGEPNDRNGLEDCVILRRDGHLNDDGCNNKYPFICKKTLASLEWNVHCNIPDTKYIYKKELGRCYKFHTTPMSWTDANTVCGLEQSYLAVINSQEEVNYLKELTEKAPKDKVKGDYLRGAVYLGFHNMDGDGWKTVKNELLEESGYDKWGTNQPDGGEHETCGSMFYNGELNDLCCTHKCFFICEHEIDLLAVAIDERFGY